MAIKKTYGAPGYMDWVAQIPIGAAKMTVHFSGGALTQYGVTPAEFTTEKPFTQKVIEKSQYFNDGRIVLLRTSGEEQSEPEAANEEDTSKEAGTDKKLEQVAVSCLQDAQAYLQEKFGIPTVKARSKAAVHQWGAEKGVEFVGL